jgi:shikimate kinase
MHLIDRPLALVGIMGAGKTSVAQRLGERLATSVADLDAWVEADTGSSVADLFAHEGEAAFRRREEAALARALAAGVEIVACGGGIVVSESARALLKGRCRTVWLEVSPEEAGRRLAGVAADRPLLAEGSIEQRLKDLLESRAALYDAVADVRVATDGLDADQVADRVIAALQGVEA